MFKGFEWVCLDPNHPDGGVLAIMAKPWANDMKFCPGKENVDEKGNWNNYRTSNVREELLLNMVPALGRENLLMHEVDLVADNGDRSYGTVKDTAFLQHRGVAEIRILTRVTRATFALCALTTSWASAMCATSVLSRRLVFSIQNRSICARAWPM